MEMSPWYVTLAIATRRPGLRRGSSSKLSLRSECVMSILQLLTGQENRDQRTLGAACAQLLLLNRFIALLDGESNVHQCANVPAVLPPFVFVYVIASFALLRAASLIVQVCRQHLQGMHCCQDIDL